MKTEKPESSDVDVIDDVDDIVKSTSPLCTYGRDEKYIDNKLWLNGISSIILYGVGDGMIPWCAVKKRIPICCLYDGELHKKTIEVFLLDKIIQKMEEVTPDDTRWYRTDAQLGCRAIEDDSEGARAEEAKLKAAAAAKKAVVKKATSKPATAVKTVKGKRQSASEAPEEDESSNPSSSSSSSSSSKKKASSSSKFNKKLKTGSGVEASN